jgi:dienelactone hydrolase
MARVPPHGRMGSILCALPGPCRLCFWLLFCSQLLAQTQTCVEREISIPWDKAPPNGLDALLVYFNLPGRHALVVLTHGSSREMEKHAEVTPWQELPQALWFARRGWIAIVVVRRGYGNSGGEADSYHGGRGRSPDYEEAGRYSADALRRAIDYARALPEVDGAHIIAVGTSTGGFATVALTADAPGGLVAAINFSGGRGSQGDNDVRDSRNLIRAYKRFGESSRVPMLWLYSQNDKYFWPDLAQQFAGAFGSAGGHVNFILAPPIGSDGHVLFRSISIWSDMVDDFLRANHLVFLPETLPEPSPPDVPPPTDSVRRV